MTRRVSLNVDGGASVAELDETPTAAEFWQLLPLRSELLTSMWSGLACELALPLLRIDGPISVDVAVGELAIGVGAEGPVLLIAYGPCRFHTAVGPTPATVIGRLTRNNALMQRLEAMFDEGALTLEIAAI
jgi:hypothetical protein